MKKIYCLKCKTPTASRDVQEVSVGKRLQLKARCVKCDSKKCQFVSLQKRAVSSSSSSSGGEEQQE